MPAAVLVQAVHVQHAPHTLSSEVVSLRSQPTGYATRCTGCSYHVLVAEEAKGGGDDAAAIVGGGGHQVAAQPALARAIP